MNATVNRDIKKLQYVHSTARRSATKHGIKPSHMEFLRKLDFVYTSGCS